MDGPYAQQVIASGDRPTCFYSLPIASNPHTWIGKRQANESLHTILLTFDPNLTFYLPTVSVFIELLRISGYEFQWKL